jgi:hypothetical protein
MVVILGRLCVLKGKIMRFGALSIVFASGILLSTAGALAQTAPTGSTAPAAPAAAPSNSDDVVTCRYEKTTGSNFARRICHTQREWHQMNVDAKDMMDNLDRGSQGSGPGG